VTIEQEATEVTEDNEFKYNLRFLCYLLFMMFFTQNRVGPAQRTDSGK